MSDPGRERARRAGRRDARLPRRRRSPDLHRAARDRRLPHGWHRRCGEHEPGTGLHLPGRRRRVRDRGRCRAAHPACCRRHGARAAPQAGAAARGRCSGTDRRSGGRGPGDDPAAPGADGRCMAGDRIRLPGLRLARVPCGRGQARGHLRSRRHETSCVGGCSRRSACARHQRIDRWSRARSGRDRFRERHRPPARRCAAGATGDQRCERSSPSPAWASWARRTGRAPEGPDGPVPARRRGRGAAMSMPPWCGWHASAGHR